MRLQEQRDEQLRDGPRIVADLVVARRRKRRPFLGRVLQSRQRRLASHRCALLALRLQLAGQSRQHRIVPQLVVVVEVLIAQRDAEHPLTDQSCNRVLDALRVAPVPEASGKPANQPDRLVGPSQQQCTRVRADHAAVERAHNGAALHGSEIERILPTLCRHRGSPPSRAKSLSQNNFR